MHFLIVEDNNNKRRRAAFASHFNLQFTFTTTPVDAIRYLEDEMRRAELDGVIADFALDCQRLDNSRHRVDVSGPDGNPYAISTGLGVLDWIHRLDPRKPLWALTDVSAAHSPLFMSAAALWLDAKPLSLERLYEFNTHAGNRMFEELWSKLILHPFDNPIDGTFVEVLQAAAQGVGEKFLGETPEEILPLVRDQNAL